ncbi:MAG: D-2-hydroxyacid dehydrogenase [Desulfuromonadales bacterium]
MKIVVLDGFTSNPGDMTWDGLRKLGPVEVYDRTPDELVEERCKGAEAVLTNKVPIDGDLIDRLPDLKYIGILATGVDIVDLKAARSRNLTVTNVPGYSTDSVAQMTFALLLEMTQQVGHHSRLVKDAGRWASSPDFCFWDRPLLELNGQTIGLVGFGQIGRRVAAIARSFGMEVVVHTAHPEKYQNSAEGQEVRLVELNALLSASDVVSLHCPLTDQTRGMINAERLRRMKPAALLLNTARGPLLDEKAVAYALNCGRLGGLGADVLSSEPPALDNPLLSARNAFITPHIGWATREARRRLMKIAAANVQAFLEGKSHNVVN